MKPTIRTRKKRQRNNRGFSLVELLVAVTILAIIAIPLMHGFVSAASANARARKIEQATTVAGNVMEDVKATPWEELLAREERIESETLTAEDEGNTEVENYVFRYENLTADGGEYKAVVSLDAGNVMDGYSQITDYNQHALAQLYDMNAVYDAFFIQETALDEEMIADFAATTGADEAAVRAAVERNILLDIREENGVQLVEVNVAYTYGGSTSYMAPQNQGIYSNSSLYTDLRNVYVFFQPLYNNSDADNPKETITIRNYSCNSQEERIRVYLVKQNTNEALENEEYAVRVNLMEDARELSSYCDDDGGWQVLTQICTNLSCSGEEGAGGQLVPGYSTWDGGYGETTSIAGTTVTAEELAGLTDLAAAEQENWIYNVIVTVYEKDADESAENILVSLTGTKEK